MSHGIKMGASVRQVVKAPIEGVVVDKQFVAKHDSFQYLVEWPDTDGDGVPQSKWFEEDELAVLEDPVATPGAQA